MDRPGGCCPGARASRGGVAGSSDRRWDAGRRIGAAVAAVAMAAAMPAWAQGAGVPATPAADAPAGAPCELHIWPAETTHTTFQGWTHAGAVDGARRGLKGYPDLHADALDTAAQVRLLGKIDWRADIGDPALIVVIHPAPTGSDDDRGRTARLTTGGAACYRELIVTYSVVESEVFSTPSVRIMALRKRFAGAAAPVNFSSMSQAAIAFTDADKAAPDAAARMDAAVQAAFVADIKRFMAMQSFH